MLYGLLIDYEYCTGCHTCEVACQQENGLAADQFGIKLNQIGPDQISVRHWQYEFFPSPTERCTGCAERVAKGKKPSCVQRCQAGCMSFGPVAELAAGIEKNKQVLFVL